METSASGLRVAAHNLAIMPRGVGTDQLVPDPNPSAVFSNSVCKSRLLLENRLGEPETVVCLDALHPDSTASIPRCQSAKEIRRGRQTAPDKQQGNADE